MSELQPPVTTASSSLVPLPHGGIVQQTHSAAANATDVAASTSTAIAVPKGSGTRSTAAAASGGNVVALQTTATEQATGKAVRIKEDPRARLMFYLGNISSVFKDFYSMSMEILKTDSFLEIECLVDDQLYDKLTVEQCDKMLILCDALRPNLFINKCIFENAQKCGNSMNEFFKIEEVEKSLAIQNEIIVRGEKRHVSEIMYYEPSYLEINYYEPMRRLDHRLKLIRKGDHLKTFTENYKVHLLMALIFPFWVVVWAAMCVYESNPTDPTPQHTEP